MSVSLFPEMPGISTARPPNKAEFGILGVSESGFLVGADRDHCKY